MIEISKTVFASPEQMEFIIEGMRNPMDSWDKTDSRSWYSDILGLKTFQLGENDEKLMRLLASGEASDRKFMRMMPIYMRVTAPLYWWKEADTYKVATVSNSCSTMHRITSKPFAMNQFSTDHLSNASKYDLQVIIDTLNRYRKEYLRITEILKGPDMLSEDDRRALVAKQKEAWWQLIQLLPSSYNQTRNWEINYETARAIYFDRRNHKQDEWRKLCERFTTFPYAFLIIRKNSIRDDESEKEN